MILDQSITPPGEWVVFAEGNVPTLPPIKWISGAYTSTAQTACINTIKAGWALLPDTIKARFVAERIWPKPYLFFVSGSQYTTRIEGFGGVGAYGGLYNGGIWVPEGFDTQTVLHELGHHAAYIGGLEDNVAHTSYYTNQVYPYLLPGSYQHSIWTPPMTHEWNAESHAVQYGLGTVENRPGGTALVNLTEWYRINGFSQECAVRTRMTWLSAFPTMPAFLAGAFDSIPAASVPAVADTPAVWTGSTPNTVGTVVPSTTGVLVQGATYRVIGAGKTPIFTGYPWPTFSWERKVDGGAWTALTTEVGPCIISTVIGAWSTVQWRVTATSSSGSATATTVVYTCGALPVVTTQPAGSISVTLGDTITLTAAATGATSQQWRIAAGVGDIPGATGTTLSFVSGNAGLLYAGTWYVYCRFTNAAGLMDSNMTTITVEAAAVPTITTQPTGGTFDYAAAISATAAATGATSQQWQQSANGTTGWTNISGQTTTTLSGTSGTSPFVTGTLYVRCAFTNAGGTTYTSVATIISSVAVPTITTQPTAGDYSIGAAVTLTAAATGATSQKWQSSPDNVTWTDISGATATTWTGTAGTAPAVNGPIYFRCVFTNATGSTNTNAVIVGTKYLTSDTTTRPSYLGSTENLVNTPWTGSITLTAPDMSGYPVPTRQWRMGAYSPNSFMSSITGETGVSLTAAAGSTTFPQVANGRYYRIVVTNSVGSYVTNVLQVKVGTSAVITTQPDTTAHTYTLASATTYTNSFTYSGADPAVTISWARIKNGDGGTYEVLAGQTTTTLSVVLSVANGYSAGTWQFFGVAVNTPGTVSTNSTGVITLT